MIVVYLSKQQLNKLLLAVALLIAIGSTLFVSVHNTDSAVTVASNKPIYQGNPERKYISLTFNVDWGENVLLQIIEVLAEKDVKATFFLTGRWAEKNPDLVKNIASRGHEIGNHGFSHPHVKNLSREQNRQEIKRAEQVIKEITGKSLTLFAPPYGEEAPQVVAAAADLGYNTIMWTIDTIDWQKGRTVETVYKKVIREARNGAIVLMHPKDITLSALPSIIDALRRDGYQLVTVSEIIQP